MQQYIFDKSENNQYSSTSPTLQTKTDLILSPRIANLNENYYNNNNINNSNNRRLPKIVNAQTPKYLNYISFMNSGVISPNNQEASNNQLQVHVDDNQNQNKTTHKNPKISRNLPLVFQAGTPLSAKHLNRPINSGERKNTENSTEKVSSIKNDQQHHDYTSTQTYLSPQRVVKNLNHKLNFGDSEITRETRQCFRTSENRKSCSQNICESLKKGKETQNDSAINLNLNYSTQLTQPSDLKDPISFINPIEQFKKYHNRSNTSHIEYNLNNNQNNQQLDTSNMKQSTGSTSLQTNDISLTNPKNFHQRSSTTNNLYNNIIGHYHMVPISPKKSNIQGSSNSYNSSITDQNPYGFSQANENNPVPNTISKGQTYLNLNKKLFSVRNFSKSPDRNKQIENLASILDHDVKIASLEPPLKVPNFERFITQGDDDKVKPNEKSKIGISIKIQLNELLTIKKLKKTISKGTVKRMLHGSTFRMFDIQEESITELRKNENMILRDWINNWKIMFWQSKYLQRIYASYWNSPEGCLSIVMEQAKRGFLSDLVDQTGGLPEKSIQSITRDILKGLVEIHERLRRPHGNLNINEIILDENGRAKIGPAISSYLISVNSKNQSLSKDETLPKSKSPPKFDFPLNLINENISNDSFDLGLVLLQCALGPLDLYDSTNFFSNESIKQIIESAQARKDQRESCCVLHDEEFLRKLYGITNVSSGTAGNRKAPLINNFSGKSLKMSVSTEKSANHQTLLSILQRSNRYSENFINFLCCCLKIEPSQRIEARMLLNQDFFSENYIFCGPKVRISEIIKLYSANLLKPNGISSDLTNLDKFIEGLKMIFLSGDIKAKFDKMFKKNINREINNHKIINIALELDCDPKKLWNAIIEEAIKDK